jgi:hypothetical protein
MKIISTLALIPFLLLLVLAGALSAYGIVDAPTKEQPPRIDLLVIEHTPAGIVERTGYLIDLRYAVPNALIEFVDDGDALFHNGFDGPATPAGPSGLLGQPDCGPECP